MRAREAVETEPKSKCAGNMALNHGQPKETMSGSFIMKVGRSVVRLKMLAVTAGFVGVILQTAATPTFAQTPASSAAKAVPAMRSRIMTSLTGYEVDQYLQRNDILFVPVGPTEYNGGNPVDVEYVIPLAYALKLAEKNDGLVLPYLAYYYPGGTTVSRATVDVSTSDSLPYLKALTRSLIRQGFRRIVFLTSHGPSGNTMQPLVRETFDDTHVPVAWMDVSAIRGANDKARPAPPPPGSTEPAQRTLITYGAFQLVGRLNDMPINLAPPHHDFPTNGALDGMQSNAVLLGGGNSHFGAFYADPSQHGGWGTPVTAEQRADWGKKGQALIEAQVAAYDSGKLLEDLRSIDHFTKQLEQRYGDLLPPGPAAPK
jgi:creatinine amidohydrolase